MHRAVLVGTPVMELRKYRQHIDALDDYGRTPLRLAVELGNLEVVKELLENLNSNPNLPDSSKVTPLHVACSRGDIEVVDLLLRKVEEQAVVDVNGETPLITCCRTMHWEIVPRLTKIDVAIADAKGKTALHWMIQNVASISECNGALEYLLTNRCNVNAQDERGRAPLHLAASRGFVDACQILIKRGAQKDIPDNLGETPLHKCIMKPSLLQGKPTVLQYLLDSKVDILIKRNDGKTAYDVLCSMLTERTWNENQKLALEVGIRLLKRAMDDLQKA